MNCDNKMTKDKITIIIMCNTRLNKHAKIECHNWSLDSRDNLLNLGSDRLMVVTFVVVLHKLNPNNKSKPDYCEKDLPVTPLFGYVNFMV